MAACYLPINAILIDYCNQELKETPGIDIYPLFTASKEQHLSRYVDPRYISGKLRRLQWVDRKVEWAKIVAAIHEDCIIPSPGTRLHAFRAFNQVFDGFYDTMYVFAYNLIWASLPAREIATRSFVEWGRSRTAFKSLPDIKAFLYRATRDGCVDYLSRLKEEQLVGEAIIGFLMKSLEEEAYLTDQFINAEVFSELLREIDGLPFKCREVVKLTYFKSYSTEDVAGQLQTTCSDVLQQKSRGVRILRSSFLKKSLLPPQEYFFSPF